LIVVALPVESDGLAELAIVCLAITWVMFGTIFLVGRKGAAANTARRDTTSQVGFGIQLVAYSLVFAIPRPRFSPFLPMPKAAEAVITALTVTIGFVSIWFCYAAVRTLGKQWALVARVIEGHELIKQGPYGVVRNPIYLAMFGLLLDAGLTWSLWQAVILASAIFLIGTQIRIRTEEKILRGAFGAKFEEYARQVPAFLPRIFAKSAI
jgi:protein-S-isoprenylcysteine O-methyltransferase Ste14